MRFILRMVRREARASWKRLLFFFLCVGLGVGAIITIRSVIQSVRDDLVREARTLTAADVLIATNRPLEAAEQARIDARLAGARAGRQSRSIETATMARPSAGTRPVARVAEVLGVDAAFPLYGQVTLQGGAEYTHDLLRNGGALVRPELLTHLGVGVGDRLRIGERDVTIRGVLLGEPGRRVGAFSLGPRVLVDVADLECSGLLQFGSRARHRTMVQVPDPAIDGLVRQLRTDFPGQFVSVSSYRTAQDNIGEDLQRAEDYLSLVGFVMVVLGGLGVWSVTRVFVRQKMHAVAVLKCVGASTGQLLAVYVAQVLVMSLVGSLVGAVIADLALRAIPASVVTSLPGTVLALQPSAVLQGVAVGVLVSFLFSFVPLLDVRAVKPLLLLRDERPAATGPRRGSLLGRWRARFDAVSVATTVLVGLALAGVSTWQAGSIRVGLIVTGGLLTVAVALSIVGRLLVRLARPLRRVSWFPLRHALTSIGRPGNQTQVILVAVGLGAFFILGVRALQSNLLDELSLDLRSGGADLFLIDIQPAQAEAVRAFVAERLPGQPSRVVPVLRARVTGVQGRSLSLDSADEVRGQGSLAREYVLTYRGRLEANETIVAGRFWPDTPASTPEVSIEESLRDRFGFGLDDRIRFDILGRVVEARVTSVRRVAWSDTRAGGFMFVFRPGTLERAPGTFIATVQGPADPAARARLQGELAMRFPNVSAIDVLEVARTVEGVLGNVTLAVSVVGAVALLSGLLILAGTVAMTKFERLHDAAVFKTLGASNTTMTGMVAIEYGALGLLGGLVGAIAALLLTWVVSQQVLEIRWRAAPGLLALGVLATAVLSAAVGVVSSLDVLRRKPLAILRAE
jgi:putative ABC transport system permease protein